MRGSVVIGAGLAGMIAAWSAARHGAEIFLLDRGPIGTGTNSSLANGVFAGPHLFIPRRTTSVIPSRQVDSLIRSPL